MITTTYGYKLPEVGDKGSIVFNAINGNTELLRDHTHDGTDAAMILSTDIDKEALTLVSGDWIASTTGFSQSVTCPGLVTLDKVGLRFRVTSGAHIGKFINPTIVYSSLTQFTVIVNDSSLNLQVLFI